MPLSALIQKLIHMLEVGAGLRYLRLIVLGLAAVGLAFLYDLHSYRNLATQESGDLRRVLVHADDVVPRFGETRADNQSYVARPDDSDSHRLPPHSPRGPYDWSPPTPPSRTANVSRTAALI